MNVLMLGNGFDINYKLLTKYINFLNTVNYISTETMINIKTVGDVFGAEKLQRKDKDIAASYQAYQQAYDNTALEEGVVEKLAHLANSNMLFAFLLKSFNNDVGWIDFEKEISVIIHAFREFLKKERPVFDAAKFPETAVDRYVISQFNFFHKPANPSVHNDSTRKVIDDYVLEYPLGSTNMVIYKEKVIGQLEKQMLELADGLRLYLKCFVENAVNEMCKSKYLKSLPSLTGAKHVVTFNYTDTYEKLYRSEKVYHIHGSVNKSIILGVNPDETDDINSIDISFLRFKKYFQRVIHHSDDEYLAWVTQKHNSVSLLVMGHSLDITDRDVIVQMFDAAKDITVLYYSENAEASLISNLVNIYGKEKFDELRIKKRLRFLPQNENYNSFAEDRQAIENAAMARAFRQMTTI